MFGDLFGAMILRIPKASSERYAPYTRQPVQRHCYCPLRMHTPYKTPYETQSLRELVEDVCLYVFASKNK